MNRHKKTLTNKKYVNIDNPALRMERKKKTTTKNKRELRDTISNKLRDNICTHIMDSHKKRRENKRTTQKIQSDNSTPPKKLNMSK